MLTGLAARVKCAAHLGTAERTIRQSTAILASEGHSLRGALIDDVDALFGKAMHVRFAGAEVAAFDRVVEKAVHAVAVILVILCGIDPALGGDGVGAARAVLKAEAFNLVSQFGKSSCGRGASETAADDQHGVLALVLRVDQLRVLLVLGPLESHRTGGDF